MKEIIISKYGGSSITTRQDVGLIKRITQDDPRRKIIVVSAPGRRSKDEAKVTDMLLSLAKDRSESLIENIADRYTQAFESASNSEIKGELKNRLEKRAAKEEYEDLLMAFGEEMCAKLIAREMGAEYADPKDLFLMSEKFGNASILTESEDMIKKRLGTVNSTFIVPGFYGYTKDGKVATFGRNKSDLTGSYLAASLEAIVYENFTDKEGVFSADPDIISNPHKISEMTFKEMRDLSYSGFGIFHPQAVEPVEKKRIIVHIRKTSLYPAEGTYLVHDRVSDPQRPIVGIAYQGGFCSFDIAKFGLNEETGVARRVLQVFEDSDISIEFMPSAIDDISVILKENQLSGSHSIGEITKKLNFTLGGSASVVFQEHLGCFVVAGKGLKGKRGISGQIQDTLASNGVNIKFISQGSQERCIVYGIEGSDGNKAVNAVYDKYLR